MAYSYGIIRVNPMLRIKIVGKENMNKKTPYMMCSNHRGMLDIPLLNTLNLNMRWVAKRELYKMPFIGLVIKMRDDIAIDRGDTSSAKMMFRRCKFEVARGISVAIFPEGTRSEDGKMHEFKDGAFIAAKMSGAPILPVVTYGTWEMGNIKKSGKKLPITLLVSILPEISAEKVKSTPTKELTKYVYEIMLQEHKKIAPDVYKEDKNSKLNVR